MNKNSNSSTETYVSQSACFGEYPDSSVSLLDLRRIAPVCLISLDKCVLLNKGLEFMALQIAIYFRITVLFRYLLTRSYNN